MDFVLRNNLENTYQTFTGEKDRAELIKKNVNKLKKAYPHIDLYYNFGNSIKEELGEHWEYADMYEKFIMEFNQLGGEILSAWNPRR